jgi:hypothetical protein
VNCLKCIKMNCTNEANAGRTCCPECLTPYLSNGIVINPPDISESAYKDMVKFFRKYAYPKILEALEKGSFKDI